MSFVNSLNETLATAQSAENTGDQWVDEVVEVLVKSHSDLLLGVESGQIEIQTLELELAKLIEQMKISGSKRQLIQRLINHMFGYGLLQRYIEDPEITDIIMPRWHYGVAIKRGEQMPLPNVFPNQSAFERFLKLIVIRQGGKLNEKDAHARVSDVQHHLRINAVIPPRAASGPMLTIRKHLPKAKSLTDLKAEGLLNEAAYEHISKIAVSDKRFIICGKGAAGKTTLLRGMLKQMGDCQRIMICESDQEIFPESPNMMVQTLTGSKDSGHVTRLDDLVKDGLTMNMDGYCIGEITGKEAWSFIKAGFTDHRIMGTLHASSAEEVIDRLLTLCELPETGIDEQLARKMIYRAIDYVIYVAQYKVVAVEKLDKQLQRTQVIYRRGECT